MLTQCSRSVYWRGAWPTDTKLFWFANLPLKQIYSLCARRPSRTCAGRSTLGPTRPPATGVCASPPSTRLLQASRRPAGGRLGLQPGRRSSWMNRARSRHYPKVAARDNGPELTSKVMRRWRAARRGVELHPARQAHLRTLSWRASNGKFPDSFLEALAQSSPTPGVSTETERRRTPKSGRTVLWATQRPRASEASCLKWRFPLFASGPVLGGRSLRLSTMDRLFGDTVLSGPGRPPRHRPRAR